jgi:hypothetical protein
MRKVGARTPLPLDMVTSTECLIFAASRTLDVTNLGSRPRKLSSQSFVPFPIKAFYLFSNGPHFVHVEVFNKTGTHNKKRNPSYSLRCLLLSPAMR